MRRVAIILVGYGNVGKVFLALVLEKKGEIGRRFGLELVVDGVVGRGGVSYSPHGIQHPQIPLEAWQHGPNLEEILDKGNAGVLVECIASSSETGRPGLAYIQQALDRGWHVVTADKGPLIGRLCRLQEQARRRGVRLGISGATAAALPALDMALVSLAGTRIRSFTGILNGTSNYILTRIREGLDYQAALEEARARGIAEPDPSQDVEGWDTAFKVLLLASSIVGRDFSLSEVDVQGITEISAEMLQEAALADKSLKLLGGMRCLSDEDCRLEVMPRIVRRDHALFGVEGTEKGITFETDTMGGLTIIGGRSDPRGAAAALLKDILNILGDVPQGTTLF
jgi:homoserine dehydrogenase